MSFTDTQVSQFLTFDVAADRYALPIRRVRGILEHQPVTPVPGSSAFVRGVFNHGGVVTPVVDLAARLGFGKTEITRETCFVLVAAEHEGDELPIGLMVDAVRDVMEVEPDEIQPTPDFGTRIRLDYLEGLTRAGDGFTLIFNVDRFLTAAELLEMHEQVRDAGSPKN